MNENQLREKVEELTQDLEDAGDDDVLSNKIQLELEDTISELQLIARPNYYRIEK